MKSFLTWLKKQAASRSFLSNTLMLAGGTLAGQALLAGVLPILTRLYPPAEIGLFGMYLSFIALASVSTTLKLGSAIVSAEDSRDAAYLGLAAVTLSIPMSLLFSLILFLLIDNALLGFEALPTYSVALAFPTLLLASASKSLRFWFIRDESFGAISAEPLFRNVAKSLVQIVLGWLNPVGLALMAGDTVGRLGSVTQLFYRFRLTASISALLTPLDWSRFLRVLRRNRKFPLILLPSSLIEALALSLPVPLIAYGYGLEAAGFFSLAQQVVTIPLGFFGRSFADAFHARIAAQVRADRGGVLALHGPSRCSRSSLLRGSHSTGHAVRDRRRPIDCLYACRRGAVPAGFRHDVGKSRCSRRPDGSLGAGAIGSRALESSSPGFQSTGAKAPL